MTLPGSNTNVGIACEAWKNARTTLCVDRSSSGITKYNNVLSMANPTTGTAESPTGAGELVLGALLTNGQTPSAAGTNYTLIDNSVACSVSGSPCLYPEYWIQTSATSTNFPYTLSSDSWEDLGAAYLPNSASPGVSPNSMFTNFEGSNGVAPTASTMAATSSGFGAEVSGNWTCTNTHTDITFATAAQLSNLITSQWVNGTLYNGSGSTGFKYATGSTGDGCAYTFPAGVTAASIGFWTEWTIPNNDSNGHDYSMVTLENGGGNDYFVMQLNPTGTSMNLRGECKFAGTSSYTASVNTLYWVTMTMQTNAGSCTPGTNCALDTITIYSSSGAQLAQNTCSSESCNNPIGVLIVGNTGAETQASGDAIYFDDLVLNIVSTSVGP